MPTQAARPPFAFVAGAYAGTAAVLKGVGFLVFLWMARLLPVADYARFGLMFALQSAIVMLATAGLVEAAIGIWAGNKSGALHQQLHSTSNYSFALLTIPAGIIATALGTYLVHSGSASSVDLIWVFVSGVLLAFFSLQSSLFRLDEKHWTSMAFNFAAPLGGLLSAISGFLFAHTLTAFFFCYAVGLGLAAVILAALRIGCYSFRADSPTFRRMQGAVLPFALIAAIGWLSGYGNTYLVSFFFDAAHVARFTFAYTLSSIMQLVATALNQVWSPIFYRLIREPADRGAEAGSRRFFRFQGAALGTVGAILLVALPIAQRHFGGNLTNYQSLNLELFLLLAAYSVSIPWWHSQNYFYAFGKGRELMGISVVGSAAGFCALFAAMWLFGVLGVYVGFLLQMLIRAGTALYSARAAWRVSSMWDGVTISVAILVVGLIVARSVSGQ